ncbi:hypothetical protein [Thioalkalivibrio sp. ARh3]|uniref:hypothetical protein n=1 Tax=Thioalkalivibrio sp. ARh3 TaxID=1158148 RepID=UPI0003614341|nr:hypothetical protein [Thioalkalivibrio sp. ARh3]
MSWVVRSARDPARWPRCLALALLALAASLASASAGASGELQIHTDASSGLTTWTWQDRSLSLELAQLLPDQTRAFFQGRGFGSDHAELVASHCVFQAILRNRGQHAIEVALPHWSSHGPEGSAPPRTNRDWQAAWAQGEVADAARIAFRWALFPGEHHFEPGDWLMGMILFDLPPATPFELTLRWREAGETQEARLPDLSCAGEPSG